MSLNQVLLGLGSNTDREAHLRAGLEALDAVLDDMRCSPVFESLPVGIRSGPFLNMAVSGVSRLPLAELARRLKEIEAENGRYAPERKGLTLDIDMLLFDDQVGDFDGLVLPRAEILRNAFVLWPLALLAPQRCHPVAGQSFAQLWIDACIDQQLWPVPFQWRERELTPVELLAQYPRPA